MSVRAALTRNRLRAAFVIAVVLSSAVIAYGSTHGRSVASEADVPRAEPRDGHTVVTESGRYGTIVAYAPDGSLEYYDSSHTKYFDVDPVDGEAMTVEYAASDTIHTEGPTCRTPPCTRNVVERVNLSTGETEEIYARYDHREKSGEWHDVDRIDDTHIVVADIVADQVFVVDTETELVEWLWDAQSEFPVDGGGAYPTNWAHINDVEYVERGEHAGRIVVSLRNQDQVVFLDRDEGLLEEWTLGSEDDYDVLFEQHNPDYIPEEEGGPAVLVADSENDRVQEFQREDGEWNRTWTWTDERMEWPRDADRLPGGNTLVADTHGERILEIDPDGEIVWEVPTSHPYDVERLETGAESEGGQSAAQLGLESRTADAGNASGERSFLPVATLRSLARDVLPHRLTNAVIYVSPTWMGAPEFAAAAVIGLTGLAWITLEVKWRLTAAGVRVRTPVYRRDDE